jgi:outer membrane protein
MRAAAAALALWAALLAPAAAAQNLVDRCVAQTCKARLTPDQLLGEVQALIAAKRLDEAQPMLAALAQLPQYRFETRYLSGQLLAARGDHDGAARFYQLILADDPNQTRVRLELGREMLAAGRMQSADRQFRIAQQDDDLPEDVAKTIRAVRDVIRARRAWRLDIDLGLAPDSNINNATSAETVTVQWGGWQLPLTLDDRARAKSGTGQTGSVSGGVRLPAGDKLSVLVELDSSGTNYAGTDYDDFQVQAAAGAEWRLDRSNSVSLQAVGAQRWYGGHLVSRQAGAKLGYQARLTRADQLGVQLDLRRTDARFDPAYDGWQLGAYATYEHALSKSLVASAGLFGRRDWLKAAAFSSTEGGVIAGVGGELPMGISFGLSGSVSRARFDAAMPIFSAEPRADWRSTVRATLGNRRIALWGFSPQVSASYTRVDTPLRFFANDRLRFRFSLARYF